MKSLTVEARSEQGGAFNEVPTREDHANTSWAMSKRRDIRRLAMQVLYQMDVGGECGRQAIAEGLDEDHDAPEVRQEAVELAWAAWEGHAAADGLVRDLASDWPTHRQPPVDRAILRLAYYEMVSGHAPVKVAINEAIELAKQYASEHSPAFINGVLDKMAKKIAAGQRPADATECD